jgi:type II secretory pathway component PulF
MGLHLWRSTGAFEAMFAGLGSELPLATRILVDYRSWIYPGCFGGVVALLIAKELMVRDKRLSTMLTFLVTIAAQFLGHWMTTVYYLPLFDLIDKLS